MQDTGEARILVALDLEDLDLRDALAEALEAHPLLALAEGGDAAAVLIADHDLPVEAGIAVLRIGNGPSALPGAAGVDLVLSARISRPRAIGSCRPRTSRARALHRRSARASARCWR